MLEHWVKDQSQYFNGKLKEGGEGREPGKAHFNESRHKKFERVAFGSFVAAIVLAVILLVVHLSINHQVHFLVVIVFLAAAAAAMVHEYAELATFSANASRYKSMGWVFENAEGHLKEMLAKKNYDAAQALIYDLGKEALAENADWVRQHRLRPLRSPSPG